MLHSFRFEHLLIRGLYSGTCELGRSLLDEVGRVNKYDWITIEESVFHGR